MYKMLILLYPRSWRDQYGEEYQALLEDLGLSLSTVANSVWTALTMRVREHIKLLITIVGMLQYQICEQYSLNHGLTANILWAPTTPQRAIWLVLTTLPVFYIGYMWFGNRFQKLNTQ